MSARRDGLSEPLLQSSDDKDDVEAATAGLSVTNSTEESLSLSSTGEEQDDNHHHHHRDDSFHILTELSEIFELALPLGVSFFCRTGMASIDSAFVGHIHDGAYTPETYLAAAVLSDMVVNVFVAPPLAFNRVLNALVGQAMGSDRPRMAGVWLQQSVFWLSITMLPCLVGLFYVEPVLTWLGFSSHVAHVAGVYAKYNLLWPIPNGWYQCMRFYFQAQGKARPAMYNNIIFLFVNALLNWIFVFGGPFRHVGFRGFGFVGAAVSLSVSRILQPVAYFLYMFVYKQHHKPTWPVHDVDENDGNRNHNPRFSFLRHHTRHRTLEFLRQSLPNVGTMVFQVCASQATTALVGHLGERAVAASSALSTVTLPYRGTLSATCSTVSSVRVGYHLGRGHGDAARRSAQLVLMGLTGASAVAALVLAWPPVQKVVLSWAVDEREVIEVARTLVPAMLLTTWLTLMVDNITSGVFAGMGRPVIATVLSFGFELPMSIGGVAIYVLYFHGNLLGVYWGQAIAGALEIVPVGILLMMSDWNYYATEARRRQEATNESGSTSNEDEQVEVGFTNSDKTCKDKVVSDGESTLTTACERSDISTDNSSSSDTR